MYKNNNFDPPDFSIGESEFWSAISPDIKIILENLEKSEDWVYFSDQFPELFEDTARLLPKITPIKNFDDEIFFIIDDIIILLSVMPFRQCIYGLSWLETHSEQEFGWGMIILERAIGNNEIYSPGEILFDSSHVIKERVNALVLLDVSGQVFTNTIKI